MEELEKLISTTPTGIYREKLTTLRMLMLAIIEKDLEPKDIEMMVRIAVNN